MLSVREIWKVASRKQLDAYITKHGSGSNSAMLANNTMIVRDWIGVKDSQHETAERIAQ